MCGNIFCVTANLSSSLTLLCGNEELLIAGVTVDEVGGVGQAILYAVLANLRGVSVEKFEPKLKPLNLPNYGVIIWFECIS